MSLLFNKGKSGYPIKKGRPVRRDYNTENRWQKKQLELGSDYSAKKIEGPIIEIKPFDGIKEIRAINPEDYYHLSNYIRKIMHPSENLQRAVLTYMVNMFLNLPDNFYQPGKDYSRDERAFTREQLPVFLKSLSTLEVICGKYNIGDGIGYFGNKKTYRLNNLIDLLHGGLWDGKGSYHLIYLLNPSRIVPEDPDDYDENTLKHFLSSSEIDELNKLRDLFEGSVNEYKTLPNFYQWLDKKKITDLKLVDPQLVPKLGIEYVSENANVDKKIIHSFCEFVELSIKCLQKLPDEKTIVNKIANNLAEKGVLILEGSKINEINGLRLVDSYDNISLYQRI